MLKRLLPYLLALHFTCSAAWGGALQANACKEWTLWDIYRNHFITSTGRVIDPSEGITTSEGQSYGLFFSLLANDHVYFEKILNWTQDNLARGDLSAQLPAWKWGKSDKDQWEILDENAASDADLWIAYTLIEAGRLWNNKRYSALGKLLAKRIIKEETAVLPKMGRVLLPGPQGFQSKNNITRLNPSYLPLPILQKMALISSDSSWKSLLASSKKILLGSAPKGFAPNWIEYREGLGLFPDTQTQARGSYDAIRVYLWAGMTPQNYPSSAQIIKTYSPMVKWVEAKGVPPEKIDTRTGVVEGTGNAGFSAALIPFLSAAKRTDLVHQQALRINAKEPMNRRENYYEQSLIVFGLGWHEKRFRFAVNGNLITNWTCAPH